MLHGDFFVPISLCVFQIQNVSNKGCKPEFELNLYFISYTNYCMIHCSLDRQNQVRHSCNLGLYWTDAYLMKLPLQLLVQTSPHTTPESMEWGPFSQGGSLSWSRHSSILWNPKGHYRDRKNLPLCRILSQLNAVRIQPLFKIDFNIILSTSMSPKSEVGFSLPDFRLRFCMHFSSSRACCMYHPPHHS